MMRGNCMPEPKIPVHREYLAREMAIAMRDLRKCDTPDLAPNLWNVYQLALTAYETHILDATQRTAVLKVALAIHDRRTHEA